MDLNLSDEQRLLRESADRFVAESYDADHRRKMANDPLGFSPSVWKQFAELGWLALPLPEEFGGLGGGAVEIGILMEAFGRGLVSEPYVATAVLGAALIARCGTIEQNQASLPKVADGSLKLAFAHSERATRFDLAKVTTSANKTAQGWRLAGSKVAVLDGHAADQIIVSAHIHDHRGRRGGSACSSCRRRRQALSSATIRVLAADVPATSSCSTCICRKTCCSVTAAMLCRRSNGPSTAPWQHWVRKPSASCRRCWTRRWNTPRSESSSAGRFPPTR